MCVWLAMPSARFGNYVAELWNFHWTGVLGVARELADDFVPLGCGYYTLVHSWVWLFLACTTP